MKPRGALLFLLLAALLLSASARPLQVARAEGAATLVGGGYRLLVDAPESPSARGGDYQLFAQALEAESPQAGGGGYLLLAPAGSENGCCCLYLPCVQR